MPVRCAPRDHPRDSSCSAARVKSSAGKKVSSASSCSVTSTGVPKMVMVLMKLSIPCGVFNLKDAIYYLAVTYFFLLLAVKTLEAKRWQ